MLTPPAGVSDSMVLDAALVAWDVTAVRAEHLPVGFGAHHWRVGPLFVTLDALGARHSAKTLEAAYGGAAALDLPFVVAPLRSSKGTFTVPFAPGALSATPWTEGARGRDPSPAVPLITALHATPPPSSLPWWRPLVSPSLVDELGDLVARPWGGGPHGEEARALLRDRLGSIADWTARYHSLASVARSRPWVATHGEPHERNLLLTDAGPLLVDWESLKLAPAERDLRVLGRPGDEGMLELFDLEWRLDEIAQFAAWLAGPHGDTEDDRTAIGALRWELQRP